MHLLRYEIQELQADEILPVLREVLVQDVPDKDKAFPCQLWPHQKQGWNMQGVRPKVHNPRDAQGLKADYRNAEPGASQHPEASRR